MNREQTMKQKGQMKQHTWRAWRNIIERGEVVTWMMTATTKKQKMERSSGGICEQIGPMNEEIDERDFLLLQRDQDVQEGDDDSVGATSVP